MSLLKIQHKNGSTLVSLGERLDVSCAKELYAELNKVLMRKPGKIVFDAGNLAKFDTAALQLFIACRIEAKRIKKSIEWANLSRELRECLEYSGMNDALGYQE